MTRRGSTPTTYAPEGWCPHCHVSHPPGTKTCLHCGGRVVARPVEVYGAPPRTTLPSPFEARSPEAAEDQAEGGRAAGPLRIGMAALWIVMAIVAALMRACQGDG